MALDIWDFSVLYSRRSIKHMKRRIAPRMTLLLPYSGVAMTKLTIEPPAITNRLGSIPAGTFFNFNDGKVYYKANATNFIEIGGSSPIANVDDTTPVIVFPEAVFKQ